MKLSSSCISSAFIGWGGLVRLGVLKGCLNRVQYKGWYRDLGKLLLNIQRSMCRMGIGLMHGAAPMQMVCVMQNAPINQFERRP